MKIVLFICLLVLFLLVGCTPKDETPDDDSNLNDDTNDTGDTDVNEPVIDYNKVYEISDTISILTSYEELNFKNESIQAEIELVRTSYDTLNDDEKALVEGYDAFLAIEAAYEEYLEQVELDLLEKQKIKDAVAEAAKSVRESLPSTIGVNNLDLPKSYTSEDGINVYIGWTTSDFKTISTEGLVTQPRGATTNVTLKAVCRSGSESQTVEKTIKVVPLKYETLPAKPVFAYFYNSQSELTEIERQTIDVINLSFGGIDDNGNVYVSGLNTEDLLQERKNGIRVTFSVQSKVGFKTWTKTAANREKLAQSFLDVVESYHFDGVDIDWEYPEGPTEVDNYNEFIKLLYTKLKAANKEYLVTSAMYGGNASSNYDASVAQDYLDYIHLMTYDLNSREVANHLTALRTSSNSYISVESTVNHYKNCGDGISKDKLVIGGAFYGKIYKLSTTGTKFIGETPLSDPETIRFSAIKTQYLSKLDGSDPNMSVTRHWDANAEAPYLAIIEYNNDKTIKSRSYITYDDPESLVAKANYVFSEGLGGMMFWELGEEDRMANDLVSAIKSVFKK